MSEAEKVEKKKGWRWGVNRWILLIVIIFGCKITSAFPPARPAIFLPAEAVVGTVEEPLFNIGSSPIYLTNTLIATAIADVILLLIVFLAVRPAVKKGYQHVAKGVAGFIEAFSEILYNLTESSAGKWTKFIFPWFAAITLMVLTMNWMELFPGVDSIGVFEVDHFVDGQVSVPEGELTLEEEEALHIAEHEAEEHYYELCNVEPLVLFGNAVSIGGKEVVNVWVNDEHEEGVAECAHAIVPFVRAVATDLNFTVALALVSVVMIQFVGVKALGIGYFEKFIYVRTIFTKPFFGLIDFFVGIFEIVSELSKIISFSFRLFGNVFAGAVLLFVIGTLIPVVAQAGVLMMEFGVGLIQAIVFGMLTMIFMSQATQSHHGDGDDH